ncbi:hypothetical protein C0993_007164 [Termitomyces sp. T159_Od127]|nr:hypothetical protein C0993_007164 [Termitomyces sp. T159_Od127]
MTATVIQSTRVSASDPFKLTSRQSISAKTSHASTSRPSQPGYVSETSPTSPSIFTSPQPTRAFDHIRSSLEHNLRSATRSKKECLPIDDSAAIIPKQVESKDKDVARGKEKTRMFRVPEAKAIFRRTRRQTSSPLPPIPDERDPVEKIQLAGLTNFVTPTMPQGSMSTPSLHLSSHSIPSPKSRSAISNFSLPNSKMCVTQTQDHRQQQGIQPSRKENSVPTTSAPRREASGQINACVNQTPVSRHRSTKSVPVAVPSVHPSPNRDNCSGSSGSQSPETPTPPRRAQDISNPSVTPAPMSSSGKQLSCISSRRGNASLSHLPHDTPLASPNSPRASSLIPVRPTPAATRGLSSTSASHLEVSPSSSFSPSSPPLSPRPPPMEGGSRRSSIDTSRRGRVEATRRPSINSVQRAGEDTTQWPPRSPAPIPAPVPPTYMQNTYFNILSPSLASPNAEYLELIRTASSLLCEVIKVPLNLSETESGLKDWEEVEVRTRALARAEWKRGESTEGSSSVIALSGGDGVATGVEEREKVLFADSLRDGYVLCQLMNKLRAASVVKPDARDDGIIQMSNITKFLAACSSCGLAEEDLFLHGDLKEATGESLARVARTIIALVKLADIPVVDKILPAGGSMSAMTETTVTTEFSSILDFGRSSGGYRYGTIRTVTTDLTSASPSITRTEGSAIAEELMHKKSAETRVKYHPEHEVDYLDLSKAIEDHNSSSSSSRCNAKLSAKEQVKVAARLEKAAGVDLSKGMRPSDLMDTFQRPDRTPRLPASDRQERVSVSPLQEPASVGTTHLKDEAVSQYNARHSTYRRQSVDAPVFGRDNSPDAITYGSRVKPRRYSAKPIMTGVPRTAIRFSDNDSSVPFPRTASTEPGSASNGRSRSVEEKPRFRRRFQSDTNDSSSRRRVRPKSHDELGLKPLRSRIESMVNLGARSANASASDLLARSSEYGNAVHKTLIIREKGKPTTHFQLGNCIGRGQFGTVYRALNLNTGQMVAVKRIRLEGLKESEVMTLMKEVDLVKSLSHPSIVKYEGMARDANTLSIVLDSNVQRLITLHGRYAESGSLGQTLKAFGKLNERLVAGYVVKILEGLHYLHTNDVVHCDLKAANILTTKNGNIKLSDFGVSLNLRAMEREIKDVAGTPNWMAPEVIELKGPSPKSDIWSLACTVIELLTGRPPYADISNSMTGEFDRYDEELRPKDSLPDIRRVSGELRYRLEKIGQPDGDSTARDDTRSGSSPLRRHVSDVSTHSPGLIAGTDSPPREHQFVKTTFSKPMACRVCQLNVKKNAVLCAQCSLIAHSKCVINASPTCDLRSLLYVKQGYTTDAHSKSAGGLRGDLEGPVSGSSYVARSHTSIDAPTQTQSPVPTQHSYLPTAYKIMGFRRRSRQSITPESALPLMSSSPPSTAVVKPDATHRHKMQISKKPVKDRPHSVSSNNTDPNSLSSASIPAESSYNRHGGKSVSRPKVEMYSDATRTPQVTELDAHNTSNHACNISGTLPAETLRHKKRESSPGCSVQ